MDKFWNCGFEPCAWFVYFGGLNELIFIKLGQHVGHSLFIACTKFYQNRRDRFWKICSQSRSISKIWQIMGKSGNCRFQPWAWFVYFENLKRRFFIKLDQHVEHSLFIASTNFYQTWWRCFWKIWSQSHSTIQNLVNNRRILGSNPNLICVFRRPQLTNFHKTW